MTAAATPTSVDLPDPSVGDAGGAPAGLSLEGAGGYDRADWASAFRNVTLELDDVPLTAVRGRIPEALNGTLYRNGPGRLERGGVWLHHPFDGDGMIAAVRFDGGKASLRNRFVRTEGWLAEEKANKLLYRGVFGTQKPGGVLANAFDLRLKNIANTHVVRLGDDLLALWEAAEPHALDPDTLETRGLSRLNGLLKKGEAFSAHPRLDPGHHGAPRLVNFSLKTGPISSIRLLEFAAEDGEVIPAEASGQTSQAGASPSAPRQVKAGELLCERKDSFQGFAFLHDFAITPNWAIFLQNAVAFNPLPFVLGQRGAAQCLSSKPGGQAQFWLVPRESGTYAGQPPRILPAPDGFVFHHLNAWEEGDELVLESIYYADFPGIGPEMDYREIDFNLVPEGLLERCRLNLTSGEVQTQRLSERCCEFAMVNPQRVGLEARYAWMAVAVRPTGNDPLQAVKKLDLHTGEKLFWSAAPRGFVSEPVMVPRPSSTNAEAPAEDDGWVLVPVWNGARSATDLVILSARTMEEEAVLELPLAIPYGLHGSFVEGNPTAAPH